MSSTLGSCRLLAAVVVGASGLSHSPAHAEGRDSSEQPAAGAESPDIQTAVKRRSLAPQPELRPPARIQFVADPVADGAVLSLAFGVGALSEAIIGTGEVTPQRPNAKADFLPLDRDVINDRPRPGWGTVSNVGFGLSLAFAVLDPLETGVRSSPQGGLVDAIMYAETLSITWAVTNLTKIAVRRPRPSAYAAQAELDEVCAGMDPTTCTPPSISQTDSSLSFFSGHASITTAVFATGTYLAFTREPNGARSWIVLLLGATLATVVDVGRVQSGKHFPTDVIAGSMAGIGIGVMVPHLHRADSLQRRPIWVGFEPYPGGGALTLNSLNL